MKITLGEVTQYQDIDAGVSKLQVPWTITDDNGATLQEGNQAFDLTATPDDIKTFASQALNTFKEDSARNEQTAILQAATENATAVAAEVSGFSISE